MPKYQTKRRLDMLMLDRGLVESRQKARALVMAGRVFADGQKVTKPGTLLSAATPLTITKAALYVSRGGTKLAHALQQFKIDPTKLVALDVGASTGGFTDCLLQMGAERVYALDVGKSLIHYRLRSHPKVRVIEQVNAHYPFTLPEPVPLATVDVSFISLTKVIPNVLEHLNIGGAIIALVKPQFEAERAEVGKKGIIKNPAIHAKVLGRIIIWAIDSGLRLRGLTSSPILGGQGNKEFFLLLGN